MNVAPSEHAVVKAEVEDDPTGVGYPVWDGDTETAKAIARLLVDRPEIDNPDPAPEIPKPMDTDILLGSVSGESLAKIESSALDAVSRRIESGERQAVVRWVAIALAKGWITQSEHDAIQADLQATISDPNHPEKVLDRSRLGKVLDRNVGGISASEVSQIMDSEG